MRKVLSYKEIKKLSYEEQAAIYKKYANRANTRLANLNKQGLQKDSRAAINNMNTKFYRGEYKTKREFNKNLNRVIKFLNDDSSTIKGAKKQREINKKYEDLKTLPQQVRTMTYDQKINVLRKYGKMANSRLKTLEDTGHTNFAYSVTANYLKRFDQGKIRFKTGDNAIFSKMTESRLTRHVLEMLSFLNSKTSTLKGRETADIHRIMTLAYQFNIPFERVDDFRAFLYSHQFDVLKGRDASNQVLEDFADALNQGMDIRQIKKYYQSYLNDEEMTLEQINEKFRGKRWLK